MIKFHWSRSEILVCTVTEISFSRTLSQQNGHRLEKMIKSEKVQWELHIVLPFHQISHKKMLKASFYLVHDLARLAEQKLAAKTSSKSCRLFHSSSHEENKPLQVSLPAVWNTNESPTLRKNLT